MIDPNDFKGGDDEIAEGCTAVMIVWVLLIIVFIFWGFTADGVHRLLWGAS